MGREIESRLSVSTSKRQFRSSGASPLSPSSASIWVPDNDSTLLYPVASFYNRGSLIGDVIWTPGGELWPLEWIFNHRPIGVNVHPFVRQGWLGEFSPVGQMFSLGRFFLIAEGAWILVLSFATCVKLCINFEINEQDYNLDNFFQKLIWSPWARVDRLEYLEERRGRNTVLVLGANFHPWGQSPMGVKLRP
jgi:hypothetical protein